MKKVEIEWLDSKAGPGGWEHLDELEPVKPAVCRTLGFITEQTPEYITLAQTIGREQVLSRITIPTAAITNYRTLK